MRLFQRRRSPEAAGDVTRAAPADGAQPRVDDSVTVTAGNPYPVCSQCGRTDVPLVGGWDPPICLECDAQINEDALWAEEDGR